ncbi:MAG: translation initiation factor IF-2 [Candidatus Diapherotrites archaeon]|nr:translation initiation factor IF-2 [Candidatus Diapherotrites archaeon]
MTELRTPIIAVLGHVDSGKTTFLDSVRGTALAEREAGHITQHIGATEVPLQVIREQAGALVGVFKFDLSIPGLLFIDTPGHEAFTNLRERGGSIADLAVVVADVQKGLEAQTKEALQILRNHKVPFVVALNKIDMLREYESKKGSVLSNLKNQSQKGLAQLDEKVYEIVGQLFELGFQSERVDRVKEITKEVALIPLSARTGEGIPEILLFLAGLSQRFLEARLHVHAHEGGKGSVLEVKEEKGLGKTIDVILYDGRIRAGDEIVLAGMKGIIHTRVRAMLEPKPLTDIRVAEKFYHVKEVTAAAGVKISAPGLEDAISGSPLLVVWQGNEQELIEKEVRRITFDSSNVGPVLKGDALGSLEALQQLFSKHEIKLRKAGVGPVTRADILEAASVKEKDALQGVVFAFNVPLLDAAKEEARKRNVKVFEERIIYTLHETYARWAEEERQRLHSARMNALPYPVHVHVLKGFVFRRSDPAVVGVRVEAGRLRKGIQLMHRGKVLGKVEGIQVENKPVEEADAGKEVAVSIAGAVVGRGLEEGMDLYTFLTPKALAEWERLEGIKTGERELLAEIRKMSPSLEKPSLA